jgi:hypothetical protein
LRRTSRLELARIGEDVKLISYLPAVITTLFTLAASLLLGYLQ